MTIWPRKDSEVKTVKVDIRLGVPFRSTPLFFCKVVWLIESNLIWQEGSKELTTIYLGYLFLEPIFKRLFHPASQSQHIHACTQQPPTHIDTVHGYTHVPNPLTTHPQHTSLESWYLFHSLILPIFSNPHLNCGLYFNNNFLYLLYAQRSRCYL